MTWPLFWNLVFIENASAMYETFEHTADLGLRVRAGDLDTLFAEAGRGLIAIIVENLDDVRLVESRNFEIAGTDPEYLLFDWLNELLFVCDTQRMALAEFNVRVAEGGLSANARGEPFDPVRHRLAHEIKAITYHHLKVEHRTDGWLAEVIVDI